jgi:hypothetical protein
MAKAAIVLLADVDTPEGRGRMANALTTAKEFKDAGDDGSSSSTEREAGAFRNSPIRIRRLYDAMSPRSMRPRPMKPASR